jgi:anti-sigma regulatory factor (Ser/Thr protein kinase)
LGLWFRTLISGIGFYVRVIGQNVKKDRGGSAAFRLSSDDRAPGAARRAVRVTFIKWRLSSVVDDAVVVVSELVTNAVRHGLPPIRLLLRRRLGQVRMDVDDARPDLISAGFTPDTLSESGRGLEIVAELADHAGSRRIPGGGKSVYASWNIVDLTGEAEFLGGATSPDEGAFSSSRLTQKPTGD